MGRPVGRNATAHHRLPGEPWGWPGTPPNLTDHRLRSFAVRLKNQTLAADPAGLQSALGWRGPRRSGFRLSAFRRRASAEHTQPIARPAANRFGLTSSARYRSDVRP